MGARAQSSVEQAADDPPRGVKDAQLDPLMEYQREADILFREMLKNIYREIILPDITKYL